MTVRKTATYTSGLTRQIPSWQRAVLAAVVMALALVQLSAARAPRSPRRRTEVGQWSAPVAWPLVAVHMSLEPTGQVFTFDAWDDGAELRAALGSRRPGAFTAVPYGRNLFCAGHVQLADGRTLIVGGHITADDGPRGHDDLRPDRRRRTSAGPTCRSTRWYPTATQLPDGRVLTFAGDNIVQDRPGADAAVLGRVGQLAARRSTTRRRTRGPT